MTAKQLAEIASQHGVSVETVQALWEGLRKSGGNLVQFNIPELGGMGQWMPGMVMVGKMGDHALKAKVDALCSQLAGVAGVEPEAEAAPRISSTEHWWPESYGAPGSTGGQNATRYAYFAGKNRLLVEQEGKVTAYDTTGYTVYGTGQQQGGGTGALTLSTDKGPILLDRLTVVTD